MGLRRTSEDKITNSKSEKTLFTFGEEFGLTARILHQAHINKFNLCSNCPSIIYFLRERNIFS